MHTILGEISDFGFYFSEYRTYERVFVKENWKQAPVIPQTGPCNSSTPLIIPQTAPPIIPQRGMTCGKEKDCFSYIIIYNFINCKFMKLYHASPNYSSYKDMMRDVFMPSAALMRGKL